MGRIHLTRFDGTVTKSAHMAHFFFDGMLVLGNGAKEYSNKSQKSENSGSAQYCIVLIKKNLLWMKQLPLSYPCVGLRFPSCLLQKAHRDEAPTSWRAGNVPLRGVLGLWAEERRECLCLRHPNSMATHTKQPARIQLAPSGLILLAEELL